MGLTNKRTNLNEEMLELPKQLSLTYQDPTNETPEVTDTNEFVENEDYFGIPPEAFETQHHRLFSPLADIIRSTGNAQLPLLQNMGAISSVTWALNNLGTSPRANSLPIAYNWLGIPPEAFETQHHRLFSPLADIIRSTGLAPF